MEYDKLLGLAKTSKAERIAEGFLFTDEGDEFSPGCFIFVLLGMLFLGGLSIAAIRELILHPPDSDNPEVALIIIIVGIPVVYLLFMGCRWLNAILRLSPGQIILESYPLRLGETFNIRYKRLIKFGSTRRVGRILGTWRCYEWAKNTRDSAKVWTHTIWQQELEPTTIEQGNRKLYYEASLTIPRETPPTMDMVATAVKWELTIKLDVPGVSTDHSVFVFKVLPEVV